MLQQKNLNPLLVLVVIVILGGGAIYFGQMKNASAPLPPPSATQNPGSEATTSVPLTYAMVDIAKHASAASCWSVVDGSVYDLTKWVSEHPGGPEAILGICGHDGTEAFRAQHDHARRQEDILATFKIGALAN